MLPIADSERLSSFRVVFRQPTGRSAVGERPLQRNHGKNWIRFEDQGVAKRLEGIGWSSKSIQERPNRCTFTEHFYSQRAGRLHTSIAQTDGRGNDVLDGSLSLWVLNDSWLIEQNEGFRRSQVLLPTENDTFGLVKISHTRRAEFAETAIILPEDTRECPGIVGRPCRVESNQKDGHMETAKIYYL